MNKDKSKRMCVNCYWYDPRYRDGWCDYNSAEVDKTDYCDCYDFMV